MAPKRIVFTPTELVEVFNNPDLFSATIEVLAHDINRPIKDAISTARHTMRQYAIMFPAGVPHVTYSVDGAGAIVATQSPKQQRADKPKNVPEGT